MGTVMGIMLALMLVGVLVWDGPHGMMGGHRDGHAEESTVKKDAQTPCQQPDCDAEQSKKDMNSENGGQIR